MKKKKKINLHSKIIRNNTNLKWAKLQSELDKPIIVPELEGYQTAKGGNFINALEDLQASIQQGSYTTIAACSASADFQSCSLEDQQILLDIAYAYLSNEGYL